MKKTLCLFLSFIMIVSLATSISAGVTANNIASASVDQATPDVSVVPNYATSGSCGAKASWYYYEDTKTLVISGEGKVERPDFYKPYFEYCELPFEKAIVQEGITELGSYAFSKCESMKEVSLPDSITKIGDSIFGYCKNLKSITIPKNVSSWGMNNFYYCESLEEIKVDPENETFDSRDDCNGVVVTETNMLRYACKNTTIPESVTSIGSMTFCGVMGIKELTIPDNVKNIYGQAFQECVDLETIRLHSDVKLYPSGIFSKCKKLKNVYLPDGLTSIGMQEFSECTSLESIVIPSSVERIEQSAFLDCTSLKTVILEDGVQKIGVSVFARCTALEEIVIPKSVKEIQMAAFWDCTGLKSVTVNNPQCVIGDMDITFPENAVIYGYEGSTAQDYAEHYVREFVALPEPEYEIGDTDLDGTLTIMDATEIQLYIAQIIQWKAEMCEKLADVDGDGEVTVMDVTAVQLKLVGLL